MSNPMLFVCDKWRTPSTSLTPENHARFCSVWQRAGALLVLLGVCVTTFAQSDVTDGQFFVSSASTSTDDEILYLNAQVNYSLSNGANEALNSGVPLTFETQIELDRVRRFLPDPNVVTLVQRSQLTFHALTQRFVVLNLNSSEQSSHETLADALTKIGALENLPVIDTGLLNENTTYAMRMRSVLDTRSFPAPLRMLAALFRVDDWRLESDWKRWSVRL